MIFSNPSLHRRVVWVLLMLFLNSLLAPNVALALTAGPTQPEFKSFTPVATTNMVHPFTGDFQYNLPVLNVPGADGGGYALSLSYSANPALHGEASWVGHNWTLSPGALNRTKKGLPDDYKGQVTEYNRIKPSWTFSRTIGANLAVTFGENDFGVEEGITPSASFSSNTTHSFSNVRGYGKTLSFGLGAGLSQEGLGSLNAGLGLNFSGRDATLNAYISIAPALKEKKEKAQDATGQQEKKKWVLNKNSPQRAVNNNSISFNINQLAAGSVGNGVAAMVKPAAALSKTFGITGQALLGPLTFSGSRSQTARLEIAQPEINYKAYGYMYNPSASTHLQEANAGVAVLSDYGVEKNTVYSPRDKVIGIPYSNADYFNAVGEGVGGAYRLHHQKVGHYYSDLTAAIQSKENIVVPNIRGGAGFRVNAGDKGVAVTMGATIQMANQGLTKAQPWTGTPAESSSRTQAFEFEDTYNNATPQPANLPFFRATGDLGGALLYSDLESTRGGNPVFPDPEDLSALVKDFRGGFFGTIRQGTTVYDGEKPAKNVPNISKYISPDRYQGSDYYKGQATYMEYVRNKDLLDVVNNQVDPSQAFEKNPRVLRFVEPVLQPDSLSNQSVGNTDLQEHIAQIRIWNPEGNAYTYGLPVYVKEEASFSYGVDVAPKIALDTLGYWGNGIHTSLVEKDRVYPDVPQESQLEIKLGQELKEWYANNYLMTQITTPDYVDVTQNGPSEDDFGGYTSFDYRRWTQTTGEGQHWYTYRTPYTGLTYQQNELAKQSDDMGSVSKGKRENYYLNAIETKSHIALFITNKTKASQDFDFAFDSTGALTQVAYDGSGEERLDGLGQLAETPTDILHPWQDNTPVVEGDTSALNNKNAKAAHQQMEKLERIVLFAKSDLSKPLVTTHFDYDYSTWTNVSNNKHARFDGNPTDIAKSGKLTLKKVWFEYQGVKSYKVSPYEFDYTYKKLTGSNAFDPVIQNRYPHLFDPATGDWPQYSSTAEQPYFNPAATDRWGNWAYQGVKRHEKDLNWLYQGNYQEEYDPAAWLLKQIKLPSGGQILVQYEEKTYQTVQNNPAQAMVSLKPGDSVDDWTDKKNKYYLNLEDMGFDKTNTTKATALVEAIKEQYFPKGSYTTVVNALGYPIPVRIDTTEAKPAEKIYFKFKYNLQNGNDNSAEFISGYADVRQVGLDDKGVFLSLGNIQNKDVYANREGIPRQICYDYITGTNNQNFEYLHQTPGYYPVLNVDPSTGSAMTHYQEFLQRINSGLGIGSDVNLQTLFDGMGDENIERGYGAYNKACKDLHFQESFIRVPMVTPKRGGGVRVKRVLMYDAGMHHEQGDAQLFGTEYHYVKEDGTCSGVASNEPAEGREENALVKHEKRESQPWLSKVLAGRDKKEGELPHGEFMLPSPSVHYGRVVLSNINIEQAGEVVTKKQAGGFTVNQYYTAADYPTKMYFDASQEDYGILNESPENQNVDQTYLWGDTRNGARQNYSRKTIVGIPANISYNLDQRWLAQGFLFIQTNMVGQQKETATYGGTYDPLYFADHNSYLALQNGSPDISLTSKMEYHYYQPGQKVKTLSYDNNLAEYVLKEQHLGLTDDITMVQQAVQDDQTNASLDLGMTVTFYGSVDVAPNIGFNFSYANKGMSRHMTTRVLYFPAVLKSVVTTMNRATSSVEHLAFSELTGSPIISKTTDGYDRTVVADYSSGTPKVMQGDLYNWNLPAAWFYPDMGQKALDINNKNQLTASVGSVTSYGPEGNPLNHTGGINSWVDNANTNKNVLAASAMTLKKGNWFAPSNDPILANYAPSGVPAPVVDKLNATYRVYQNYVYDPTTTASGANGANESTYSSGIMANFNFFDWVQGATNPSWKAVSEVTLYSPNGYALEEKDLLADIPSAAKYGYHKFLSTAVAKNASYTTIGFESFEDELFLNDAALQTGGHAGNYALAIGGTAKTVLSNLEVTARVLDTDLGNGLMARLWVKNELVNRQPKVNWNTPTGLEVQLSNGTAVSTGVGKKIAQVGEWVLLEYLFEPSILVTGANYNLQLRTTELDGNGNPLQVTVDDIRIQPLQAEMSTHVYDNKSFKLLATFGAEHFGAFYQYNEEGTLVRTLIETERGLKTIQESQSNTPLTHKVN